MAFSLLQGIVTTFCLWIFGWLRKKSDKLTDVETIKELVLQIQTPVIIERLTEIDTRLSYSAYMNKVLIFLNLDRLGKHAKLSVGEDKRKLHLI